MQHGLCRAESCWYLLKLCSMSTITREWVALQSVAALPFRDILLSAQPAAGASLNQQKLIPQVGWQPAVSMTGPMGMVE